MQARTLLVMIVVGAVVGAVAGWIVPLAKWGFAGSVLVGLGGGAIGGRLLWDSGVRPKLGNPLAESVLVSAIGAVVVVTLARLMA